MSAHAPPVRLTFVGQGVYFRQCALERSAEELQPTFIDFRAGAPPEAMLARLRELDPDVVLVFRPEIVPPGFFASVRAVTIGYLTEPLPRTRNARHPDLETRMWWLRLLDASNFDRIVSFDSLIADTAAAVVPVWRSQPLPVADSFFMDLHPRARPPRLLFLGRSTEHREELLAPLKARHEILHVGHGLLDEPLRRVLRQTDVQLNLHNNPYPSFENRVSLALAAGHLVISEPLSPPHDLIAGRDFLEASTPGELLALGDRLRDEPDAFLEVQRAGRDQAERFRASRVYPELVRDVIADVAASGGRHARGEPALVSSAGG